MKLLRFTKNKNSEPLKLSKMTFLDCLNSLKWDFTQNWSGGKIIEFQQSQSLTSHFETFWSIVLMWLQFKDGLIWGRLPKEAASTKKFMVEIRTQQSLCVISHNQGHQFILKKVTKSFSNCKIDESMLNNFWRCSS